MLANEALQRALIIGERQGINVGVPASASTWSAPQAAFANLERVPRQPPEDTGLGRLRRRADDPVPDPLRVSGAGARTAAHRALRSHRTSYGRVDGAADARSLLADEFLRAICPPVNAHDDTTLPADMVTLPTNRGAGG